MEWKLGIEGMLKAVFYFPRFSPDWNVIDTKRTSLITLQSRKELMKRESSTTDLFYA